MKIIIMAGGGGTRLWPMSRQLRPKQYQQLIGDRTVIQQTFDRLTPTFGPEDIYVAVNRDYAPLVQSQLPEILDDHIFLEPEKRDTAPAMGYVLIHLFRDFPDEPVAFIPSDHLIKNVEVFLQSLQVADQVIRETGKMIDIGVVPTFPNCNFGYLKIGRKWRHEQGIDIYEFQGQVEKPSLEKAQEYVKSGKYLWHASYFMWTPRKFLEAFKTHAPRLYEQLMVMANSLGTKDQQKVVARIFPKMEKISMDYAIAEKLDVSDVLIIPALFYWSDIGLWQVIKNELQESPTDNVTKGEHISIDTDDCLIYGRQGKMIATIGLEGMIVVDTDDALLICPKNRDKDVKKLVELLEEKGEERYL